MLYGLTFYISFHSSPFGIPTTYFAISESLVDLDLYGSPSVFLDSAVQYVADGGMLMCTATDMAMLCGGNREVFYSKVLVTDMDPGELQSDLLALRRLYCLLMNDKGVLSMTSLEVNLASIEPGTTVIVKWRRN
ncbi:probable tRNA (guanine(26)-N(2))-dimethyltransferase 2 [Tanacetum coccineum]